MDIKLISLASYVFDTFGQYGPHNDRYENVYEIIPKIENKAL